MATSFKRGWLQFSIRNLLVLTTMLAVCFGFWVSQFHRKRQALRAILALHPRIRYENGRQTDGFSGGKWWKQFVGQDYLSDPIAISIRSRPSDAPLGDAAVRSLAQFPTLKELTLAGTAVGDEGMTYLRPLRQLEHLDVSLSQVSDAGLASISGLTKLQRLDLSRSKVTDAGLHHLSRLASLQRLSLAATNVTDEGVKQLTGLNQLISLDLGHTKVRGATLSDLGARTSLRGLNLADSQLDDHGLQAIGRFPLLEGLSLDGTKVTGAGLSAIGGLAALKRLDLSRTALTDDGLRELTSALSLQRLMLNHTAITDDGLRQLDRLAALELLELRGTKITGKALNSLQGLPRLTYLDLRETALADADIDSLNALSSLVGVSLGGTDVTEAGLAKLRMAGSLEKPAFRDQTLRGLAETTDIDATRQPLCDLIDFLRQRHDCEIHIDARALKKHNAGVPVTCRINAVPLMRALEELLGPLGLVPVYRYGVLVITAAPPKAALQIPELPKGERLSPKLVSALAEKTELDFAKRLLSSILNDLAQRHGIAIQIDGDAFRRANRSDDVPTSVWVKGVPLRSALGLLLEPLDMTCLADGDALIVRPIPEHQQGE